MRRLRVGVLGGAGFTGGELIRILMRHPRARLAAVTSRSYADRPVCEAHPNLRGRTDLRFTRELDARACDGVFLAGGHGDAMTKVPALLRANPELRIVDLSGDFRLPQPGLYERWYDRSHTATHLLGRFVYGLTELNRPAIRRARAVANPGCFATAVCLCLGPLARAGFAGTAYVTAVTGSSGSGVKPSALTHHPTRTANLRAYRPFRHQHVPEVENLLDRLGRGSRLRVSLIPVSGPFARGIYAVCQLRRPRSWPAAKVRRLFTQAYARSAFVRLVDGPPSLNAVVGSNHCDLNVSIEDARIGVTAAIDNLIKGASGQAVQNFNVMMGWDERLGLDFAGPYP